ncbi:MAG: glycogen debranching enzyme N-terminal domain-containing protein, partial [Desulfamplus sp.]|nr:glycogen debranching enzyme N-terminal domain-containing protein [Desulfamplus sp.]
RPLLDRLDAKGYCVIPPSGKFRDLVKEVDFIFTELGCRVLHLLPVHPTPTTYGRMGRYGSPYAALNFTEVDPALAQFDPSATPLEQFMELADAVHSRCGYLILDIAINHTGWASSIHESHPEWLVRREDGTIEVPGAWGVQWEDLTRLDYSKKELWQYMADMFLLWCRRRVDGFRCDAGYMIPAAAWEYIVARVRQEYPDTIFFLEGLGGGVDATCDLLNVANLNWAYSELFQNYDRHQIENYLPQSIDISEKYGLMVHFAETHDNQRLAAVSHTYAMMRTSICALFSVCGSFGFAAGVEWFATHKINVHDSPSLNWGAEVNQIEHIRKLNYILRNHPTFTQHAKLSLINSSSDVNSNCIALLRYHPPTGSRLLVLANLDCNNQKKIFWNIKASGIDETLFYNLLTDQEVEIGTSHEREKIHGENGFLRLMPGEVVALCPAKEYIAKKRYLVDAESIFNTNQEHVNPKCLMPKRVLLQKFKAKALKIAAIFKGYGDVKGFCVTDASASLFKDPVEFCRSCNPESKESRVVIWKWGRDNRRTVMVPPGNFLMVIAPVNFRAEIRRANRGDKIPVRLPSADTEVSNREITVGYEEALPMENGEFFAIFMPLSSQVCSQDYQFSTSRVKKSGSLADLESSILAEEGGEHSEYSFRIMAFVDGKAHEKKSSLLYLANPHTLAIGAEFTRKEIMKDPSLKLLGFNKKGAMLRAAAWWGRLESRYDALLAANLDKEFPENRWILLSRYRIWAIYQGYSRELTLDCLERFTFSHKSDGKWLFNVPTSEGSHFKIEISLEIMLHMNCTRMKVHRRAGGKSHKRTWPDLSTPNNENETVHFHGKEEFREIAIKEGTMEHKRQTHSFSPGFTISDSRNTLLPDDKKIEIVIRPDIEDRSFHDTVKAWTGPEHNWSRAVKTSGNGFIFNPAAQEKHSVFDKNSNAETGSSLTEKENMAPEKSRALEVRISNGKFIFEPEWTYMVYHPLEAERGLDPHSDLFSPGYFTTTLTGGQTIAVRASTPPCMEGTIRETIQGVMIHGVTPLSSPDFEPFPVDSNPLIKQENIKQKNITQKKTPLISQIACLDHFDQKIPPFSTGWTFSDAIQNSLDAFIVERGNNKSVIAGYPWFLDWGRDSLIFCRALIEAGRFSDAKDILRLFGSFEYNGTLPNMICGSDAGNRETSDAPLWFFAACRELAQKEGESFLDERVNSKEGRTFREVLISMAHSLVRGTNTGMGIDPETNLFYSPSHFTWMDTNFPAGSPRQGYPVEIQALWYYALVFLD